MEEIFALKKESDEEFERLALKLFRRQALLCEPYAEYLRLIGCNPLSIRSITDIPFLPIELFKSHKIYCDETTPEAIFTSSGEVSSHHYMSSLSNYERAYTEGFRAFYGEPSGWSIYALLPSYLEREGSSLIYMVEGLRAASGGSGGFYLYDHEGLIRDMRSDSRPKILLGVTYALLDLAESGLMSEPIENLVVMETGGMKGRREELHREELHKILCEAFHTESIHSEFGMAELTSQGYSAADGVFQAPPWMRVLVRDLADPFCISGDISRGGINIIDLASTSSCAFIETQDMGAIVEGGGFRIEGRIKGSDIRGCNLLLN